MFCLINNVLPNNIDCYFKRNSNYSSLLFWDNNKNKNTINIYFKIIKR